MASNASSTFSRLTILLIICLPLTSSIDFNYPAVFNFGDSNSDTGNLVAGLGAELDPPNGQNYFQKPSGRLYHPFGHSIIFQPIFVWDSSGSVSQIQGQSSRSEKIVKFGTDPSKLDGLGCVSSHNQASKLFNLQLHALLKKLQGKYQDANVTYVDIFTIKSNLIANYSRYGFKHTLMTCCGYGGPPSNYDSGIACGQTKVFNGSSVTAKGCNDSKKYVNWDGTHYAEAANQYVASEILTGKYSDPPLR